MEQGQAAFVDVDRAGEMHPVTCGSRRLARPPIPLTPFIGRTRELREVRQLLLRKDVRLLTLAGPGGIGKTRLAIEAASKMDDAFPDGIFFVSLAAVADHELVAPTVAGVLGVKEEAGDSLEDALVDFMQRRRSLLVLDNFEHVLAAAKLVATLFRRCPHVTILVTSRSVLHLRAECDYPVPRLTLPDPRQLPPLAELASQDAIQFFSERARASRPGFELNPENAHDVAEICLRLDGLPLALELAAARIRLFPPKALAHRLGQRFDLLTGGARDVPARQQTLRDAIDWSYRLLTSAEQTLFARLSVFRGGCTLEAIEAACGYGDQLDVPAAIGSLVDQSLLQERGEEEPRYLMLETIREFAAERLVAVDEDGAVRSRHAEYFAGVAEQAEQGLTGEEQTAWVGRLEREHDNLQAALRWSMPRSGELGLRLASALWRFWSIRGYQAEGRRWLEEAVARSRDRGGDPALRAKALNGAGGLAINQGAYGLAQELYSESLQLCRGLGDRRGIAASLHNLGVVARCQGDLAGSRDRLAESLRMFREARDEPGTALALHSLGWVSHAWGDHERSRELFEECLLLYRALGNSAGIANALTGIGFAASSRGDYDRAEDALEESLRLSQGLGNRPGSAHSLHGLGDVARGRGRYEQAERLHQESLRRSLQLGDEQGSAGSLRALAALAATQHKYAHAVCLLAAATVAWERIGFIPELSERREIEEVSRQARHALGVEGYEAAWASGAALSWDEAAGRALGEGAAYSSGTG
ncbi:MAG TPA: tetratricopeptide repeat protein [Chloroflexota bacterium]|nr:tetratricopeptide repeat protein [Chloroflexota bacterium]